MRRTHSKMEVLCNLNFSSSLHVSLWPSLFRKPFSESESRR